MFDILNAIPGKRRHTSSGWYSFNAVCCHHRGHKADSRMRGGIKFDGNDWRYHCFNCGFTCGFILGKTLSLKTKKLLKWCNVDDDTISALNLDSIKNKDLFDLMSHKRHKKKIKFSEIKLPQHFEFLDKNNHIHKPFIEYIETRGISFDAYPFMVTPTDLGRNSSRIIIPYTFNNKIVGYTSRYLDNKTPKYIKEQQPGYVFGLDLQKPKWNVCLVFEGIFDAISLNGVALTHDTITDEQADLLKNLRKKIIVVPDQDSTGLKLCDRALELGFNVSIPTWGKGVKDANDAVVKYGKFPAILSIIQAATNNKIKVEMARRKCDRRL